MIKSLSLAIVALVLMAGSAFANDVIGTSDIEGISSVDNAVVEAGIEGVDFDSVTKGDKNDEAVEACFRGWGGHCGYNYGCYNYNYNYNYNYCYSHCYHYCYQPVVYQTYCYRPVCYSYYSYPSLCGWGCY